MEAVQGSHIDVKGHNHDCRGIVLLDFQSRFPRNTQKITVSHETCINQITTNSFKHDSKSCVFGVVSGRLRCL